MKLNRMIKKNYYYYYYSLLNEVIMSYSLNYHTEPTVNVPGCQHI